MNKMKLVKLMFSTLAEFVSTKFIFLNFLFHKLFAAVGAVVNINTQKTMT